jgi:hypothetical protein|tara:strand:- start:1117 stop:1458 length:342 start_codon:yes stop_codon:yes gene_type:complete
MIDINEIIELKADLQKLLKKSSPLPPLNDAFFINGIEINLEDQIDNQPFTILLDDGEFYELTIEFGMLAHETLDRTTQRNEKLTKIELSDSEKILHLLEAIKVLKTLTSHSDP